MKAVINRIFLIIIYCALIFKATNIYASDCTTLPVTVSSYLEDNTAYGYIKDRLYMNNESDINYCNAIGTDGDEFKFCVKNDIGDECITKKLDDTFTLGEISSDESLGKNDFLKDIFLGIEMFDKKICLTMPTSRGITPIMCRTTSLEAEEKEEEEQERVCRVIAESCYAKPPKSQSILSFSGLTVHCLRDTLDKVLYLGNECAFEESINFSALNPFSSFQAYMKNTVLAALMLYVMFYGFKLVMNIEYAEPNQIATFIIKFIFVLYFAVGIGSKTLEDGEEVPHNGMTELALPILVEMTSVFTDIVFSAGGSQGLCAFDANKYEEGYGFYKIWDSIDCRVGYYLGMQMLYSLDSGGIVSGIKSAGETVVSGSEDAWSDTTSAAGTVASESEDAWSDTTSAPGTVASESEDAWNNRDETAGTVDSESEDAWNNRDETAGTVDSESEDAWNNRDETAGTSASGPKDTWSGTTSTAASVASGVKGGWGNTKKKVPDGLKNASTFALFVVLGGLLLGGQVLIVMFGLVFAGLFISMVIYFITTYLICMITLYVMAYISPIFIPMILFEKTKGYFDAWLKTVISCTLQPAVIGAFIALLLTMYDSAIYGNCEFQRHDHTAGKMHYSTFELVLPSVDIDKCTNSTGYKLLMYYKGKGWHQKSLKLFSITLLKDSLDLFSSILYTMIYMFIFSFFIERIDSFASDLTGGSSIMNVSTNPAASARKNMSRGMWAAKGVGRAYANGVKAIARGGARIAKSGAGMAHAGAKMGAKGVLGSQAPRKSFSSGASTGGSTNSSSSSDSASTSPRAPQNTSSTNSTDSISTNPKGKA